MKKLIYGLFLAFILALASSSTALAIDLQTPGGNTIEGLPTQAENAARSGVVDDVTPPPCVPPCIE